MSVAVEVTPADITWDGRTTQMSPAQVPDQKNHGKQDIALLGCLLCISLYLP